VFFVVEMVLKGVVGDRRRVNSYLFNEALKQTGLLIDCSNCANPHALFPIAQEELENVHVIQVELIYVLRDVLKKVGEFCKGIGTKKVIITTFGGLFNYQDERENKNIYEHSWELMKELSQECEILVGIHHSQEEFARKFCDSLMKA